MDAKIIPYVIGIVVVVMVLWMVRRAEKHGKNVKP